MEYPCRFASSRSSDLDAAVVVVVVAYIVEVAAAANVAYPLGNESTPNASNHDAVVAYASAFLEPCHGEEVVVQVQVNPSNPYAFVDRVVELFALEGAFAEAQVDAVNGVADVMNNLVAAQNYPGVTVTVTAFRMNDMVVVAPAYPHCGVDDRNQDYSLDDQLAFQQEKDFPVQHDQVA